MIKEIIIFSIICLVFYRSVAAEDPKQKVPAQEVLLATSEDVGSGDEPDLVPEASAWGVYNNWGGRRYGYGKGWGSWGGRGYGWGGGWGYGGGWKRRGYYWG
ncbi:neuropeptide-like protein 32 [Sitophilus oryzae]|uniref:Neuropeptide-like protein 32 n=1 Tax=Sitophilus oryzae TaxID=7048 RepID=A0A6J2Y8G4_SITOR|nr:neuropeptide-like protein 32 [Sitophilus oryzae]